MKVQNFNKGNYSYLNNHDCVYYGKIIMTYVEFCKAVKFLIRAKLGTSYEQDFYKKILKEDLRKKESFKKGFRLAVRVTATERLFERFNLPRYKGQNYYLEVITK